jgi:hypothetical protein
MIIYDSTTYIFRVVEDDHQLTATQQVFQREQIRPRLLSEIDEHGVASLREDSHNCCKQEAHE